ncbi:hypothetical protein PFISCL1PPCAC_23032, partial [Pristionchus fissidentatus]
SGEEEEEKSDDEEYKGEKEYIEPLAKKRKMVKKKEATVVSSGSKRIMECPKCKNFRSKCVTKHEAHLKSVHEITPADVHLIFHLCIMFLCDCGHKSASNTHYKSQCGLRNFKIIHEKKFRVKCIQCESRLSTTSGYTQHLIRTHSTSLRKNGIHLLCACGVKIVSSDSARVHMKICEDRHFIIEKN